LRLPRDLSGDRLAALLRRYGYEQARQTGSHLRLTTSYTGTEHHVTIPRHRNLRVGTLSGILGEVAAYLAIDRDALSEELFR
jgi:predicted RNA binding protein YcfA (HicA-like mRNA interferase family)